MRITRLPERTHENLESSQGNGDADTSTQESIRRFPAVGLDSHRDRRTLVDDDRILRRWQPDE